MRKSIITFLALVLFTGFSGSSLAFADDENKDSSWSNPSGEDEQEVSTYGTDKSVPEKHSKESQDKHKLIEDQFEDVTGVVIPPIVIRPGTHPNPKIYELPVSPDPDSDVDLTPPGSDLQTLDALSDTLSGVTDTKEDFMTTQLTQKTGSLLVKTHINPNRHKPVQIKNLVMTDKTPTDEFMRDATVFGGVLGATAIGLLALAGFNSLRLRRDPKANYIYEAKD